MKTFCSDYVCLATIGVCAFRAPTTIAAFFYFGGYRYMIKISAGYNYINPNFVIQNMCEPESWAHPVFAILKNLLMRGCPTIPSLYLREKFGEPEKRDGFTYCHNFDGLNWSGVIKGGYTSLMSR